VNASPSVVEVLDDLLSADVGEPVDGQDLAEVRADLEVAAARAASLVDGHGADGVLPLRLPKGRVVSLAECERCALATSRAVDGNDDHMSPRQLLGRALDVYVEHEVVAGPIADPLEDLLSWLAARGELDVRDQVVAAGDGLQLAPLAAAARAWSGLDAGWWPRTQASAAVHLADGSIRCEGRTDVELGGPLSGRPSVVVEVKLGRPHHGHLAEATHYALLVALRDRRAPAAVARWYPGGALAAMAVTADVLHSAARRLADAIGAWAELQVGRTPTERAGPTCAWCPDADRCPSYLDPPDPFGDDEGPR
jgi:hypothetical protein